MSPARPQCYPIPLSSIAFSTDWSLHPWESEIISENLLQSFHRVGILHKPIVLAREGDFFEILSGFKRLQFALASAHQGDSVECLVFAKDTEIAFILDSLLTDQSLAKPLSLAEKAQFVKICSRYLSNQDIVSVYLERLQLKKKISTIEELKNILRQDPLIITEIHNGRLQDKMVAELLRLQASSDRVALVHFFRVLVLGDSKQKRFFSFIRDLAFRHNSPIADYLKSPAIFEILTHPVMNVPQKIQHLNNYLQLQLCPMYEKAEEDFTCKVRDLRLPPQCTLSHSPSFEKDTVTLSINFDTFADCATKVPDISKILLQASYTE